MGLYAAVKRALIVGGDGGWTTIRNGFVNVKRFRKPSAGGGPVDRAGGRDVHGSTVGASDLPHVPDGRFGAWHRNSTKKRSPMRSKRS